MSQLKTKGRGKEQFKKILQELKEGEISERKKQEAKKFLQDIDPKTLGEIEQELIREGISHEEVRRSLCDIHLEALRDTLVSRRAKISAPHPVHTFMEEHKIIIEKLNELSSLVQRIKQKNSFKEMRTDLEKLRDISHHLVEAELHHQREEEAIFPRLRKHGIVEPPDIMQMDHTEFKQRKKQLHEIAKNPQVHRFEDFKEKVIDLGEYLVEQLNDHIFKEDNILYQIALQVLTDEEWEEVKAECDQIGYCCFTPAEAAKDSPHRKEK